MINLRGHTRFNAGTVNFGSKSDPDYPPGYLIFIESWIHGVQTGKGPSLLLNNTNSNFTLNAWFNPTFINSFRNTLFSSMNEINDIYRGVSVFYGSTSLSYWFVTDQFSSTKDGIGNAMSIGTNTMVSLTYGSNTALLYINGVLSKTTAEFENTEQYTMKLGSTVENQNGNAFVGTATKASSWERQLSQQEITDLYNNGNGLSP